jgi:acyl-CoA thioesterase FadM
MQTTAAPFRALECAIRPEWLSASTSHLFIANYVMLFNDAARNLFTAIGLDSNYMDRHAQIYVAGGLHVLYEREIFGDEVALVDIIVADTDEKRVHLALEMFRRGEPKRICFAEMLFVSVSRATGRSAPWAGDVGTRLAAMQAKHGALPRPRGLGQTIGIKRRQAV